MGSTTPPAPPSPLLQSSSQTSSSITKRPTPPPVDHQDNNAQWHHQQGQLQIAASPSQHLDELAAPELRQLVMLRDQEIRALKFELEKYKLALHQSQQLMQQHNNQQMFASWHSNKQQSSVNDKSTDDNDQDMSKPEPVDKLEAWLADDDEVADQHQQAAGRRRTKSDHQELGKQAPTTIKPTLVARLSSTSLGSSYPVTVTSTSRVIFRTGADELEDREDDNDENDDDEDDEDVDVERLLSQSHDEDFADENDNLDDIIQDVGEIDLDLELVASSAELAKKRSALAIGLVDEDRRLSLPIDNQQADRLSPANGRRRGNEEEAGDDDEKNLLDSANRADRNNKNNDDDEDIISDGLLTSLTDAAISNLSQLAALQERCESQQHSHPYPQHQPQAQQHQQQQQQQPIRPRQHSCSGLALAVSGAQSSATGTTNTATTNPTLGAIGAINQSQQSAPADLAHDPFSTTAIANQAAIAINAAASIQSSSSMLVQTQQTISSSSSISPTSTIQASDLNSGHSLASVVAAAAVAAAAANDHQQLHQNQQQLPHPQSRLISSAIPSPDFYHSLHQHHLQQQQHLSSPVSSLHFSPSTSVTPSSSSLLGQSRRSASNASSSLMSPISSPNYLRRQLLPDRMPLLSPSPTSGLATGSSSAASTSLAHILNHHHHQQRSASALGGPISSSANTPLGSSGSTAVSPLMSNKNSSQARLNNMQIRHKFGYLGSGRAQFNSPHGFCLGLNQEIVVADTNNHRVCIFDKSGSYITQFGSPGKEEGQLWNPRKVAILHRPTNSSLSQSGTSNQNQLSHLQHHHQQQHLNQPASSPYSSHLSTSDCLLMNTGSSEPLYVVCDRGAERSRMQLFTKDGVFIKKIGIHYIDIVAGLAITQNGLIIVVDSVSPTVYIINGETGILNGWFDCSGHMKEPSDIAVKSDVPGNEYFICDFKGHCVVVFSEQGEYLRKIGHDGLTSYPNGIDISDDGDILVGDSHGNRFHVVVFDRNGNFVSQFECPHVKVSRCCGLKITREGYIVTLAKNNHHVLVLDTIHI